MTNFVAFLKLWDFNVEITVWATDCRMDIVLAGMKITSISWCTSVRALGWPDVFSMSSNVLKRIFFWVVVVHLCPTLCDPTDCSMPGFPLLHHLPELAQTHVHWIGDTILPSNYLVFCRPLLLLPQSLVVLHIRWPKNGASASASVLPVSIQDWFPLGLTGLISLQSKGLSRVFSNTTVQKPQFFSTQLSSQSNSHIHAWPLEKP